MDSSPGGWFQVGKGKARVLGLSWGRFSVATLSAFTELLPQPQSPQTPGDNSHVPSSLVIAADVFYDVKDYEDVLASVYMLNAPLLTVFQDRCDILIWKLRILALILRAPTPKDQLLIPTFYSHDLQGWREQATTHPIS